MTAVWWPNSRLGSTIRVCILRWNSLALKCETLKCSTFQFSNLKFSDFAIQVSQFLRSLSFASSSSPTKSVKLFCLFWGKLNCHKLYCQLPRKENDWIYFILFTKCKKYKSSSGALRSLAGVCRKLIRAQRGWGWLWEYSTFVKELQRRCFRRNQKWSNGLPKGFGILMFHDETFIY